MSLWKLDDNTWPRGLSWTKGYLGVNKDYGNYTMWVHSGPFFFIQIPLTSKLMFESYIGFRPTPSFTPYKDASGFIRLTAWFWEKMNRWGWGNFGLALRICHYKRN